ncbi:hypothetical protein M9Y10_016196 [Tritrichomonas musculus]|uniref:Uncharacterized protein n=1 Tax=Tritrichomonas musculus TaxID=1915356 RepID=A0ABR2I6S5_9EUKA
MKLMITLIIIKPKVKNSITQLLANKEKNKERRRVVLLQTSLKQNDQNENFFNRLRAEYLSYEDNYSNDRNIYFIPLLLSDINHELFEYSFRDDLQKINKLIFTIQIGESVDFVFTLLFLLPSFLLMASFQFNN